jgi:RNA polymerase sigma-70 factor, ECF subfamily
MEGSNQKALDPRLEATSSSPDRELMIAIARGDEAALGDLYDRYSGLVYSVALRILRDAAAAEEILQDIFFQLWRKASQFDASRGSLPGWLSVMTRNRAISRLRKRNPHEETNIEGLNIIVPYRLENALVQREMIARVRGAMDGLPAPQRDAIELAYFEGLTHSEIAERTGEPLGTVKTRLRTAVETLRLRFA